METQNIYVIRYPLLPGIAETVAEATERGNHNLKTYEDNDKALVRSGVLEGITFIKSEPGVCRVFISAIESQRSQIAKVLKKQGLGTIDVASKADRRKIAQFLRG